MTAPHASPRRIAFLITSLARGGAETQVLRLGLALRGRGCEVLVVSLTEPADYVEQLRAGGVRVESLGMRRGSPGPGGVLRLVRLLRGWRPEVLVTFLYHANLLGRLAGRACGVPLVVSSVRTSKPLAGAQRRLFAWTDRLADATTANSAAIVAELVRDGLVAPHRAHHIPNAILLPARPGTAERSRARAGLGAAEGDFLWLAVGNLVPDKDYPTLLRAFALHRRTRGSARLAVAGAGPLAESLRAGAAREGLGEAVRFLGSRSDVPALLAGADAFVMSSAFEGVPNALMEALAAGLPAVATAVGGVPELLREGEGGLLVPAGEPEGLAAAMDRIAGLPAEARAAMGEAGRVRVAGCCEVERVVDRWQGLFRALAGARADPAVRDGVPSGPAGGAG